MHPFLAAARKMAVKSEPESSVSTSTQREVVSSEIVVKSEPMFRTSSELVESKPSAEIRQASMKAAEPESEISSRPDSAGVNDRNIEELEDGEVFDDGSSESIRGSHTVLSCQSKSGLQSERRELARYTDAEDESCEMGDGFPGGKWQANQQHGGKRQGQKKGTKGYKEGAKGRKGGAKAGAKGGKGKHIEKGGKCNSGEKGGKGKSSGHSVAIPGVYKTKLCAAFEARGCTNGNRCRFAHGVAELKEPDQNALKALQDGTYDFKPLNKKNKAKRLHNEFEGGRSTVPLPTNTALNAAAVTGIVLLPKTSPIDVPVKYPAMKKRKKTTSQPRTICKYFMKSVCNKGLILTV